MTGLWFFRMVPPGQVFQLFCATMMRDFYFFLSLRKAVTAVGYSQAGGLRETVVSLRDLGKGT